MREMENSLGLVTGKGTVDFPGLAKSASSREDSSGSQDSRDDMLAHRHTRPPQLASNGYYIYMPLCRVRAPLTHPVAMFLFTRELTVIGRVQ